MYCTYHQRFLNHLQISNAESCSNGSPCDGIRDDIHGRNRKQTNRVST